MPAPSALPQPIADWFSAKGWALRPYQWAMLDAAEAGQDALLVAPTGAGKTLSGFLPTLAALARAPVQGLHTLYISPLKALGVDVHRNLALPIAQMGLPITLETRNGDTSTDRKRRQRARPPNILLTTPESLSLMLSYPDSFSLFATLRCVVIDEVHAFATTKRGDLLALALARLQRIAPDLRRTALSATVADPAGYAAWIARPDGPTVRLIAGEDGAPPDIRILLPEGRVPWAGHSGRYAVDQVMALIAANRQTLVFANTRGLAEMLFQELWRANTAQLPIGIHHGSLSVDARRKVEAAMAEGRLRGLVATSSLDLGVDWGDVDCVVQMGAPKGSSRLLQRIGRANHRLEEPSRAVIVPGNRFEYLEARAALDAVEAGVRDGDGFRPGALDVLAQHILSCACAGPFAASTLFAEVRGAAPYSDLDEALFHRVLAFVSDGGYALSRYDRYRRLVEAEGQWRLTHPRFAAQHRLNAGVIVEAAMIRVCFRNGRSLGQVEEHFAAMLSPGDCFFFSGLALEVERMDATDLIVRASKKPARVPSYSGARMALTAHLADRVRGFLAQPDQWIRFPPDVRAWLAAQQRYSTLPAADELLVETFPHEGRHHMLVYAFAGWNAHQALGMLVTSRMERMGLKPMGFAANDYALGVYGLDPITDPARLLSPHILEAEFLPWVEQSHLLKRAFRDVAVIGGLVDRHHPGQRKSGRQVTFSTDLIFDVLRRYEPGHVLMDAAWADARTRLTDVDRLATLLETAVRRMVHNQRPQVTPLAIPLLLTIGREAVASPEAEAALLAEAEAMVSRATGG